MAPRLNKRQLREQEELLALSAQAEAAAGKSEDVEDEESDIETSPTPKMGFAALALQADEVEEPEDREEDEAPHKPTKAKKSKKKKKKTAIAAASDANSVATTPAPQPEPQSNATANSKPSKKSKGKSKAKKDDRDDLDKALEELSIKYPELQHVTASTPSSSTSAASRTFASLLSVSLSHLDAEAEMKKFFGAKVVTASKGTSGSSRGSPRRQVGAQRSHLTRPGPSWWSAKQREGLSIRQLAHEEVDEKCKRLGWVQNVIEGERWWTVEYSKKYKGVTMAFIQIVMSGDPNGFYNLLGKLPWHGDTLLQLSEVYRHREEYSQAVDFVERALFTYERSFIGAFNFTSGMNRIDFDQVENRPFFLALHRQVTDLQRRGCVRTAFEFARLLYGIDPWSDPHGALLHLDFLAFKGAMSEWLIEMWEFFDSQEQLRDDLNRVSPSVLPGWMYARALALRIRENTKKSLDHEASTKALTEAILDFPSIVPLLADKADISFSSEVRSHSAFKIATDASSSSYPDLHLLSHLYAQRSFSLWKDSKISSWFKQTVESVFPQIQKSFSPSPRLYAFLKCVTKYRFSVYRHCMVNESTCKRLFSFIPRAVLDTKQLQCDPLPPATRVNEYDQEFFKGTEDVFMRRTRSRRDRAADQRLMEQLVPDPVFRRQLEDFFNAHPQVAERFPGGVVQFAQAAAQLPEEVLEDIMIAAAGPARAEENNPMPGQMPGEEMELHFADHVHDDTPMNEVESDEDSDDAEAEADEEPVAPLPIRLVRNILGRFWGGTSSNAANAPPEDGDDSEDEAEQNNDVD